MTSTCFAVQTLLVSSIAPVSGFTLYFRKSRLQIGSRYNNLLTESHVVLNSDGQERSSLILVAQTFSKASNDKLSRHHRNKRNIGVLESKACIGVYYIIYTNVVAIPTRNTGRGIDTGSRESLNVGWSRIHIQSYVPACRIL